MRSTFSNLLERRHLLWTLIGSNLKRQNKSSALGYLWWLFDPILMAGVYYIILVVLFQRGGQNRPVVLFLLCGLLPWKAFSQSVSQAIGTLRGSAGIIRAISFPKAVLPLSLVLSNAVYFIFALVVIVVLGIFYGSQYGTWPNVHYVFIPVVLLCQVLFTTGLALIMSVLGVLFLDTSNIMSHVMRMWYFLSPGLYSIHDVPESYRNIFRLNPMCEIMTSFRDILMYGRMPTAFDLGYAFMAGAGTLVVGYIFFKNFEGRLVQKL